MLTLSSPVSGANLPRNSSVFLRSTASMSDAVVSSVDFFVNGVVVPGGPVTRSPYNIAYTATLPPGSYTVSAQATLADGATVDSATGTLNVVT
ncbi:MAG: Ig-like domain-containing protein, partial [Opitutaceae bacterium]